MSTRHPGRVLTASVAVGVLLSLGILRLRVDTNHINFFSRTHPLGESAAIIDSKLAGVYSYQLMLEGPPESLQRPDMLSRMDQLQEELRRGPHVRKVSSVADYVKRIHRELGSWLGGVALELTGSYDAMWQLDLALALLAAVVSLTIPGQRGARRARPIAPAALPPTSPARA